MVNEAFITQGDVVAGNNGIVHYIDAPLVLPGNFTQSAEDYGASLFAAELRRSGLDYILENEDPVTIFAPSDRAVKRYFKQRNGNLMEMLQTLVVPRVIYSSGFEDGQLVNNRLGQMHSRSYQSLNDYATAQLVCSFLS